MVDFLGPSPANHGVCIAEPDMEPTERSGNPILDQLHKLGSNVLQTFHVSPDTGLIWQRGGIVCERKRLNLIGYLAACVRFLNR